MDQFCARADPSPAKNRIQGVLFSCVPRKAAKTGQIFDDKFCQKFAVKFLPKFWKFQNLTRSNFQKIKILKKCHFWHENVSKMTQSSFWAGEGWPGPQKFWPIPDPKIRPLSQIPSGNLRFLGLAPRKMKIFDGRKFLKIFKNFHRKFWKFSLKIFNFGENWKFLVAKMRLAAENALGT